MHRSLVPIQVWLTYLLEGGLPGANSEKRIPSKVIGVILTAMYMVIKGKLIMKDAMAWKIAASRFWQNIVSILNGFKASIHCQFCIELLIDFYSLPIANSFSRHFVIAIWNESNNRRLKNLRRNLSNLS